MSRLDSCAPLVSTIVSLGFELIEKTKFCAKDAMISFLLVSNICVLSFLSVFKKLWERKGHLMVPSGNWEKTTCLHHGDRVNVGFIINCMFADTSGNSKSSDLILSCLQSSENKHAVTLMPLAHYHSHGCLVTLVMSCSRGSLCVCVYFHSTLFHYC